MNNGLIKGSAALLASLILGFLLGFSILDYSDKIVEQKYSSGEWVCGGFDCNHTIYSEFWAPLITFVFAAIGIVSFYYFAFPNYFKEEQGE